VASAFNPKDDNKLLTLTGLPDVTLLLWHWEKGLLLAKQHIGIKGLGTEGSNIPYQLSYNPFDMSFSQILVTGPSTFVYLKVMASEESQQMTFNVVHSQLHNHDEGRKLSD
jgi:hypothetical protein